MTLRKFNRILHQVSFLPVLLLGVMSGVLYLQILHANRTVALIQRSDQRISQATLAAKLIVDEETGLRGYQVTGDERFLQPYREAQGPLDGVLKALDAQPGSIGPDGLPVHGIVALKEAHEAWRQSFAAPIIESVRTGGAYRDPAVNLRGKQMMDAIRAELAGVVERSEERRARRIGEWQRQVRGTELALFGLAIGASIVIGLFMRNRMHWVSETFRGSLDDLTRRTEELTLQTAMLTRQKKEIFASEQRLRTTITSIGDGVITCDLEGRVQMMNTAAVELTGWTQEEAVETPLEQVFRIVNETTRKEVENPITKVRRLNQVVGLANHTLLIRRDGRELHIADSGAPIRDEQAQTFGFVLVFRDVTTERRTQDALIAQEKLAVAGRLAATIAHEINNPLSSVLDMLYLMRNGVGADEAGQYMQMAEAELTRVGEIVRAMLGLYRESQVPIPVDLGATMHDVLLLSERKFAEQGVLVIPELPKDICVFGFPAELRQVFMNLVTNAAEAAGRGGEVRVEVSRDTTVAEGGGLGGALVTIADTGPGIPEEVLAQLFQPFFTTKGEHGTGLGLWVSKGIVSKHNGTIDLSRNPVGRGTTSRVFLPAGVPPGSNEPNRANGANGASGANGSARPR